MPNVATKYSLKDKLSEVRREIKLRKKVYPGWVASRYMDVHQANTRIEIMYEIEQDYTRAVQAGQFQLFEESKD